MKINSTTFSVGIATYNSSKYIYALLDSIFAGTHIPNQIIIYDDNSKDDTIDLIESYVHQENIELIKSAENKGHAYAMNAIQERCTDRFLVIMDHDIEIYPDCLELLVNDACSFSEDEAAVTASIINTRHGSTRNFGFDLHYLVSSSYRDSFEGRESGNCATTCVLVDLEKSEGISFQEELFIYNDDLDYFYQFRSRGLKILVNQNAVALHKEGTPELSGITKQSYTKMRDFYITRNRLAFYWMNYSWKTLLLLSPAIILFEIIGFIFSIKQRNFGTHLNAYSKFLRDIGLFTSQRRIRAMNRKLDDFYSLDNRNLKFSPAATIGTLEKNSYPIVNRLFKLYYPLVSWIKI